MYAIKTWRNDLLYFKVESFDKCCVVSIDCAGGKPFFLHFAVIFEKLKDFCKWFVTVVEQEKGISTPVDPFINGAINFYERIHILKPRRQHPGNGL